MVRVTIEVIPHGIEAGARIVGIIEITNDGSSTNPKVGNYMAKLSHAGKFYGKRKGPYKRATVRGFARQLSPYRLLYRVLRDAGEI